MDLVKVLCLSLLCCALLCVLSSFAIILKRKRVLVAFAFIVLQMSFYCKCSVTLPQGAMGWFMVCDCGIFDHTHFLFMYVICEQQRYAVYVITKISKLR